MQVEVSRVDDATARLTVTLTAEEVGGVIDATYQRLGQRLKIPGFRPGKAPRAMILRAYGEEDFYHTATDEAIRKWYPRALAESDIRALDAGELDHGDGDHEDHLTPGEPFTFGALVPVVPELELPNYGEIKIPAPDIAVQDADVDKIIDDVRLSRATLEPAAAKAAAVGDVVKMNVRGRAGGEEVLNREDFEYELVDEEKSKEDPVFPGLATELIDARPGDIREITLTLPAEYRETELAGKALILNIVVKEILRKVLPELTDEFAQEVSKEAKTVSELRDVVRHNLEHERTDEAIDHVAKEVIDSLIARSNPPAPEVLVEEEQQRILRDQKRMIERAGMKFDRFLIATQKSEDEYLQELRPAAERAVKRDLILDAVAKAENLEPTDEEVDAQVRLASQIMARSELESERFAESRRIHVTMAEDIRRRRALTKLVEIVSGLKPIEHDHDHDHDHQHDIEEQPAPVGEPEPEGAVAGA